jgi:hypothetical protein
MGVFQEWENERDWLFTYLNSEAPFQNTEDIFSSISLNQLANNVGLAFCLIDSAVFQCTE